MPARLVEYARYLRELQRRNVRDSLSRGGGRPARAASARCCGARPATTSAATRPSTLVRRIQRRMQVHQLASVAAYVERLRQDPQEAGAALPRPADRRHPLLPRSRGLRRARARGDPAALRRGRGRRDRSASGRRAAPPARRPTRSRSCCARRCSAARRARACRSSPGDIDDEALDFARQARYPEGIAEHVDARPARALLRPARTTATRSRRRSASCASSPSHNLIRDPPFSRLDLIVVPQPADLPGERPAEAAVASIFHYALRPGGYLFLGPVRERRGPAGAVPHGRQEAPPLRSAARRSRVPPITVPLPERTAAQHAVASLGARASAPAAAAGDGRGARARAARPLRAGLGHRQRAGRDRLLLAADGKLPGAGGRRPERRRRRAWRARGCGSTCAPRSTRPCRRGRRWSANASPWRRTATSSRST